MKRFMIQQQWCKAITGWGDYHLMPAGTTREAAEAEMQRLANIFPGHTFRLRP